MIVTFIEERLSHQLAVLHFDIDPLAEYDLRVMQFEHHRVLQKASEVYAIGLYYEAFAVCRFVR